MQKLLMINLYIELLGRIAVQKLLLLNLYIELFGQILGAEIIANELVHRFLKKILFELVF